MYSHRVALDPLAAQFYDAAARGVTVNPALSSDVSELFGGVAAPAHAIKAFVERCTTQRSTCEPVRQSHDIVRMTPNLQRLSAILDQRFAMVVDLPARAKAEELRERLTCTAEA